MTLMVPLLQGHCMWFVGVDPEPGYCNDLLITSCKRSSGVAMMNGIQRSSSIHVKLERLHALDTLLPALKASSHQLIPQQVALQLRKLWSPTQGYTWMASGWPDLASIAALALACFNVEVVIK